MACIDDRGALMPTARMVLKALHTPRYPSDVARLIGVPLYRVRSSLRELVDLGFLEQSEEAYKITQSGKEKLESSS